MFAPLLIATLGIAGDLHVRGDFRASQNVRSIHPEEALTVTRAELAVVPQAALATDGRLELRFAYAPQLLLPTAVEGEDDFATGPVVDRTLVLHRFSFGAAMPVLPWRFSITGNLSTGETLLLGDPTRGTMEGQPVATTNRLPFFGVDATAAASGEPWRGTTFTLVAALSESGPSSETYWDVMPVAREIRGGVAVSRRLGRRDAVGLDVQATRTRIGEDSTRDAGYLRAGGTWNHELAPRSHLRSGAGIAWTWERSRPVEDAPALLPWLEGSFDHSFGGTRPTVRLAVAMEPTVDRFTGDVDLRSTASGSVGWAPWRRWSFTAHGSSGFQYRWGDPIPGAPNPHTAIHGAGISASHLLAEAVHLSASASSSWQLTDRTDLVEFREDLFLVELSAEFLSL